MPITYRRAESSIVALMESIIDAHHRVLAVHQVKVDVIVIAKEDDEGGISPALKDRGYPAAGKVEIVPMKRRALRTTGDRPHTPGDAIITLDASTWEELDDAEREALIDHELEHLAIVAAPKTSATGLVEIDPTSAPDNEKFLGVPRYDDLGRPKLRLRKHDWQLGGFRSIAARHGANALDVQAVHACRDEAGQWFWDFERAPSKERARA